MRFLLYNIRYAAGIGKRFHLPIPYSGYLKRTNGNLLQIMDFIKMVDPDIIGLLEVDSGSYRTEKINQAELHAKEMEQAANETITDYEEIITMKNFENYRMIKLPRGRGGHGGGDQRLQDQIFRNPGMPDPFKHAAGSRDGAMSILIGIAARKSIEFGEPVRIADLTDLVPEKIRITS